MLNTSVAIRDIAKKLLDEKRVDLIIGLKRQRPSAEHSLFCQERLRADRLIWNANCENNLAKYLPKIKERVAIVAKGCDVRSIINLIKEKQVTREQVFIIGIPCKGMIDRRKIEAKLDGKEILEAEEEG